MNLPNPGFAFEVLHWLEAGGTDLASMTTAALRIQVDNRCCTKVEDLLARTTREHIYVPVSDLVEWFLTNWWRLRWESGDSRESVVGWREAHSMAAVSGGIAWPALEISSDGYFVQFRMHAEEAPDAAGVRYLDAVRAEISAQVFEAAVDALFGLLANRVSALQPGTPNGTATEVSPNGWQEEWQSLCEIYEELKAERVSPELSRSCQLQALAGLEPGAASSEWLSSIARLQSDHEGHLSTTLLAEYLAATARRGLEGLKAIDDVMNEMKDSKAVLNLRFLSGVGRYPIHGAALPWKAGEAAARYLRGSLGIDGPVTHEMMADRFGVDLSTDAISPSRSRLSGALIGSDSDPCVARLVLKSKHRTSQRFELARLIGCASIDGIRHRILPVCDTRTWLQKYQRAFAAEFLCPWRELDELTSQEGLEDDTIEDIAQRFQVSARLVETSLANKGKLSRERLLDAI